MSGGPARLEVLFIATAAGAGSGGIGAVVPRLMQLLEDRGVRASRIVSHEPGSALHRAWVWLRAGGSLIQGVRAARRRGRVPVAYAHVGSRGSIPRKASLLALARLLRVPTVAHLHTGRAQAHLESRFWRGCLRVLARVSDRLIVVGEPWRPAFARVADPARLVLIPNPLAAEEERRFEGMLEGADAAAARPERDGYRIVTLCRLEPGKGVDRLVDALAELDASWSLEIGGEGRERTALEARAERNGVDHRVRFHGWLDAAAKAELLQAADVFCLPSTYESFGLTYFEALSHRVPVVAADRAVIRGILPGQGVLFADPDSPASIATAVGAACREPTDWPDVAREVLGRYRGAHVAAQLAALFEEVAGTGQGDVRPDA